MDAWSPDRRELAQVQGLLRIRFGRRRLFRVADVNAAIAEVRARQWALPISGPTTPDRAVETPLRGTPATKEY